MPTEPDEGYLDDEFAKFRAARLSRKAAGPLEPHATTQTQTPPRTTRPPPPPLPTREHPHEAAAPKEQEAPQGAGRRIEVVDAAPADDDFERFRAQRLRETGKRSVAAEPAVTVPLEPTTLAAPEPKDDPATRPTVRLAEAPEDGLFFGTSTTERQTNRAHAREARGDAESQGGDEAA